MFRMSSIVTAFDVPFLVIAFLTAVNQLNQRQDTQVGDIHLSETRKLDIIAFTASGAQQTILDIVRDEEGRALRPQMRKEFRKEDLNARQVEIAEMNIVIGNRLQPVHQILRLRLTGNQQQGRHTSAAKLFSNLLKNSGLPFRQTEVLHVLDAHDNGLFRNTEVLVIADIQKTPGAGT